MSAVAEVHTWEETEDPFRLAASYFPAGGGRLAVEPSTAYDDVERLLSQRPGWKPFSASAILTALRMVKTPDEIEAIRRAIAVALPRFEKAFASLSPGSVEAAVSHDFGGANVVQFGSSSALPHGASSPRALQKGEAVLIDAWDKPEGYYYDITRSTYFGKPTEEYRNVWSIVLEAQSAAIEKAAPGVACFEVDRAARRVIEKAGYGEFFTRDGKDVEALATERKDLRVRTSAVRSAGVVAEVDRRFGRRTAEDLPEDRQPADPGVEDADRARIGHVSAWLRPAPAIPGAPPPAGQRPG